MKYTLHIIMTRSVLLAMFLVFTALSWAQEGTFKNGIRQGQIKVKFAPEMSSTLEQTTVSARTGGFSTGIQSVDQVAKATKASNMYRLFPYDPKFENKLRRHGLHLWYVVEFTDTTDPNLIANQFRQLKEVSSAEVDREKILSPYTVTPYTPGASTMSSLPFNDPLLVDQWHYTNTRQNRVAGADVNLFEAWKTTTGSADIIVAVHDEGIDVNHEDLKANMWVNVGEIPDNGIDDDGNGYIDDVYGYNFAKNRGKIDPEYHGTHVAGTVAAVNNNGKGVSGVAGGNGSARGAKIMSLQIMGGGRIENSFIYAANNGAVISQNSWGYTTPGYFDESVKDAINYFIAEAGDYPGSPMRGGIVIFAAGNNNFDAQWYPGYYEGTLSVAALGPDGTKASYSNFGTWVDISAPGGDGSGKDGVLSTIPNNKYAYLQGTSMACPHVSGIAALALSNRDKQVTNTELWNKLLTGIVSIDEWNENFEGALGTGAVDASLAIKNNLGKKSSTVTNLTVTGVAQEFATLSWSVPTDEDDGQPVSFTVYYYSQPLSESLLPLANKVVVKNTALAGTTFAYELGDLLGLTTYYFGITSTDRWGNISELSNIPSSTTNEGPSIAVDPTTVELMIDASISTLGNTELTILNNAAGILRWNSTMRQKSTSLSWNAVNITYPKVTSTKSTGNATIGRANSSYGSTLLKSNDPTTLAFTPVEKELTSWVTNIIGETNLSLTNSAAAKFYVSDEDGFNLTQVRMYLKHDPSKGPVVVEIFQGSSPSKENLVYAQEYSSWGTDETWAYITLNEQLYFETGTTFWVAFHVPAGNLYPLGIGYETEPNNSANCFISFNVGATWQSLEDAINNKEFAWAMGVASYNEHLGTYLTLTPSSGDINGNEQATVTLEAVASTLINGTYEANMILTSNDAQEQELRVPVTLTVTGQVPNIKHVAIADYGAVFAGSTKTIDIVLDNQGYGNFNDPSFTVDGNDFAIDGWAPWRISARTQEIVRVTFNPSSPGNKNGILTITNGTYTYTVALTGVGAETSTITLTPEIQQFDNLAIGDEVSAEITVENTGAYPLQYFIPGYDTKGVSTNWPTTYHTYGYKFRTNYSTEGSPIAYDFQDIKATGIDITSQLIKDDAYVTVDMGFSFPYYGQNMRSLYIAQKGFTTFDNSVRPINTPTLGNPYTPAGYISVLGTWLTYITEGKIFYQQEADRLIIQYDNVTDGYSGNITAQMVLFANGDIRFYYENMGYSEWSQNYLNILIEDLAKQDGIMVNTFDQTTPLYSGLALGFDYPGPDIIASVKNGSGTLSPGNSAVVEITLNTASLAEGTTNRYINFISNDPASSQKYALIQLNVTEGGVANPALSTEAIDFGTVFQGAISVQQIIIKNQGTANADITSMTLASNSFLLSGENPTSIKPGLYKNYTVTIPTTVVTSLSDVLTINYADGTIQTITIDGNVVDPPAIVVDLSLIETTLNYGETVSYPLTFENTGLANLEVATVGKQWIAYESETPSTSTTYVFEKENTGGVYQWIDIRKTGVQMPFAEDVFDETQYWRNLTLPFPFDYFGKEYTKIKIGENGIISFEENPATMIFTSSIPNSQYEGSYIMPYWTFGGFSTFEYAAEDVGIFYQMYDDKVIITWSYLVNFFGGMGDPVSAQIILYNTGTMKFQYKVEESGQDLTSNFTAIGLQENSLSGISISNLLSLDYGAGLAYGITPSKKYVLTPGTILSGELKLDARNIFGGSYTAPFRIQTNVPGSESLEKPIHLTVVGQGLLSVPAEVDFESKFIAYEWGSPVTNFSDVTITNTGTASLDITWIEMTSGGNQFLNLQVYMLVNGWFGPTWEWVSIDQAYAPWFWPNPVFTIMPGDKLLARATFSPSENGTFEDEVVFTTSVGEVRMTVKGEGTEPPVLNANTDEIKVSMNMMTETDTRSISFNNSNGKSDLHYSVSVDYGRAGTTSVDERQAAGTATTSLNSTPAYAKSGIKTNTAYNRILTHTEQTTPDTHVGTGGSAPFTVATKFNAGAEGFNLSHVETWFRAESLTTGRIEVEIRAGGQSITEAITVAQGTVTFNRTGGDDEGNWQQIAMDKPATLYPNEDFYIVVTYPLGISFPQGTLSNEPATSNRYFYSSEGLWFDLQQAQNFSSSGWLMYAAEEKSVDTFWLSITSLVSGTLAIGESGTIELLFEGAYAFRGDQIANVVITSNDPNNATMRIPVSLHVNEAPHFRNVPEAVIMTEKEVVTITIPVIDTEGNSFTIAPKQTYSRVKQSFANGILTITLSPDYGDKGSYSYVFVATDEFNAVNEMTLSVEVMHTNQAPQYIGSGTTMTFDPTGELVEYAISSLFTDPDGDAITFNAVSGDLQLIEVFISTDKVLMKPKKAGETTLTFTVSDNQGAKTITTLGAIVNVILSAEVTLENKGVKVYPNPAEQYTDIDLSYDWNGEVLLEVVDINGRKYQEKITNTMTARSTRLDVSGLSKGLYFVRATSFDKQATLKFIKK